MFRRLTQLLVGAVALYPLSMTAVANGADGYHHGWDGGAMGTGGGWFGVGMMLLWMVVLVAAVVGFVYWAFGGKSDGKDNEAMEILRGRYARGDIDEEELRERRRKLTED
ncbi:SHOCT domain-containing protein [Haladaptatus sp. F3-133]|uniref:SHOCT domain-containing protein n=1 Tax=Halorutilus salinus TaxID=2487751 RepID=A0A9Q4GHQ0_9EURY|nr:SHOCT domain-containing protein [Halorutilus salinus]